jgi:hypothetical protein
MSWMRQTIASASLMMSGSKITFSLGSIQLSSVQHWRPYRTSEVPFSDSLGSCCCMRTQPMTDSCPSYQDVPSRKPLAYLQEFALLTQFGYLSVGDWPSCGSSGSWGTHAVAPKSEWQTATLNQRPSSSELHANIICKQCRSWHTSQLCTWCWHVLSGRILWVDQRSPKSSQTCGQSMTNPQWSPC